MVNQSSLSFEKIKHGDHYCTIYQNKEQQFDPLVIFFRQALNTNNKCLYVADENLQSDVISEFKKRGLDLSDYI